MLYELGLITVTVRFDNDRIVDFTMSYLDRHIVFDSVYQRVEHYREVPEPSGPGILKHAEYEPLEEPIPRWVVDRFREASTSMPAEVRVFVLNALTRYFRRNRSE